MTSYSYTQQFLFSEKSLSLVLCWSRDSFNISAFLSSVFPVAVLSKHCYGDSPRLRGWVTGTFGALRALIASSSVKGQCASF